MFDQFVSSAGTYIETNPWLAIVAVFLGGILTASNPCVLAMIPLTMSFVAGDKRGEGGLLRAVAFSGLFVVGISIQRPFFCLLGPLTNGQSDTLIGKLAESSPENTEVNQVGAPFLIPQLIRILILPKLFPRLGLTSNGLRRDGILPIGMVPLGMIVVLDSGAHLVGGDLCAVRHVRSLIRRNIGDYGVGTRFRAPGHLR